MRKALQSQLRMSRIAKISLPATDSLSIMEEKILIDILIKDLEEEKEELEKLKNKNR